MSESAQGHRGATGEGGGEGGGEWRQNIYVFHQSPGFFTVPPGRRTPSAGFYCRVNPPKPAPVYRPHHHERRDLGRRAGATGNLPGDGRAS